MKPRNVLNIGLDLDGVIIDHSSNIIKTIREWGFYTDRKNSHLKALKHEMPVDLYTDLKRAIYGEMSLNAKIMIGSKECIKKLASDGHELYIVSRRDHDKRYALSWLGRRKIFEFIPEDRVIFVSDDKRKATEVKRLAIDIFLDDKVEVLFYVKDVAYPVLFNQFGPDFSEEKYEEVGSWREFLNLIYDFHKF